MKIKASEKNVSSAISDYLSVLKIIHWRQNSGMLVNDAGKKIRYIKFLYWLYPSENEGLKFLDLAGILPDGRYFTVEVKASGEKPTKLQLKTITTLNIDTNAVAMWADSIDMFKKKFNPFL